METIQKAILNKPLALKKDILDRCIAGEYESFFFFFPFEDEGRESRIENGVAQVDITGYIDEKHSWFLDWMGGTSTERVGEEIDRLLDNPKVNTILLSVDSPGGNVDGVVNLSKKIFESREKKEIIAVASPSAYSAGYWIASSAGKLYLSSSTSGVGSIGVATMHVDRSKQQEKQGVKVTDIYSGKYKRIASANAPLSEEGRSVLQSNVDYLYGIFVEDIARNRGKDVSLVLSGMADGRDFLGKQAIEAGLADGFKTVNSIFSEKNNKKETVFMEDNKNPKTEITLDYLKVNCSALYESIQKEAYEKGLQEGIGKGKAEGAKEERERIASIDEIAQEGFEKLVAEGKKEGWTAEKTALEICKAQKERGVSIQNIRGDSTPVSATAVPGEAGEAEQRKAAAERMAKYA